MTVVIVDDHPLAIKGITAILSRSSNIKKTIEASNIEEALNIIGNEKTDVAIIDLKLKNEDGLEIVTGGKKINPNMKFIILTSYISQGDFLKAEKIEVDGYLLKEATAEDLLFVVDLVSRGKKYYDPEIIKYYKKNSENQNLINQLTNREKEVLYEMGKGLSNLEIAENLYISHNTVKKHISRILSKLNLKHRSQIALFVKDLENEYTG
jgi:DNA-binding NarL/FixJ family response regulator